MQAFSVSPQACTLPKNKHNGATLSRAANLSRTLRCLSMQRLLRLDAGRMLLAFGLFQCFQIGTHMSNLALFGDAHLPFALTYPCNSCRTMCAMTIRA